MKKIFIFLLTFCMATIMASAIIPAVSAEETEENTGITVSVEDDGSKAYDLVWKYKYEGGHLYRRRWNKTLNCWYDPAWILVQ